MHNNRRGLRVIDKGYHDSVRKATSTFFYLLLLLLVGSLAWFRWIEVPTVGLVLIFSIVGASMVMAKVMYDRYGFYSTAYAVANFIETETLLVGLVTLMTLSGPGINHSLLWAFYVFMSVMQAQATGMSFVYLAGILAPPALYAWLDVLGLIENAVQYPIAAGLLAGSIYIFYADQREKQLRAVADRIESEKRIVGYEAELKFQEERHEYEKEEIEKRDTFMALAAHELRTPLTAMSLHIQMVNVERAKGEICSSEKIAKHLDTCINTVTRMTALVNELLDTSRIQARKLVLECGRFDILELVKEVAFMQKKQFKLTLPDHPIEVTLDYNRVLQVVNNIMSNAVKYGNGKANEVTVYEHDKYVYIDVRDYGKGMTRNEVSKVFDRYEQVGNNKARSEGLGLGLFIAHELTAAHGGYINVQSEPGKGSTFSVRLPLTVEPHTEVRYLNA